MSEFKKTACAKCGGKNIGLSFGTESLDPPRKELSL